MENDSMLGDIMDDVGTVSESKSSTLTFLAWIRVQKGEQLQNQDLVAVAGVLGSTAERALANGNTKVFNDIGRKATLSIYRHLNAGTRALVNPSDVSTLEAMLKEAKEAKEAMLKEAKAKKA